VIPISLSAAAAEAHRNDLLADADTARRVRQARQATMDIRADSRADGRAESPVAPRHTADSRRQPHREINRGLVAWRATSAATRSLRAIVNSGRFSRAATVSAPTEGDA
jgi:hypothetical protein